MTVNKYCKMFLGAAVLSTSLMGCVEPEDKNGGAIDHSSAQQAINASVNNLGETISNSLAFLEDSKLFSDNFDSYLGGGYECEPGEEEWCEPEEPTPFDSDVSKPKEELIKALNERIFTQKNVESETGTSVTYLLKGDAVCVADEYDEPSEHGRCVKFVNDAQIRLIASSAGAGSADVSVKIGPNRISPINFEFRPKMIAASPNIGEMKKAAEYLAPLNDEDADISGFPAKASGELRLSLQETGDKTLEGKIAITKAIDVGEGDWALKLAAAPEGFVITADGLAKTIKASLGLGEISGLFPYSSSEEGYGYDEEGNEIEPSVVADPVMAKLNIGGLSGSALFDAGKELLSLTNLSLGAKTSTLDLNDKRVLSVDLNKDDGRSFDVTIKKPGDHTQIELSPAFDLRMILAFAQAKDELESIQDWMFDEVMSIKFTGASPAFELNGDDFKVLSGKLSLTAEKAGISHVVEAGQCLVSDISVEPFEDDSDEPIEGEEPVESGSEPNPLEELVVGTCG